MKKACFSLIISLFVFFVFACKMPTLPSKVEITGSPSIKIAANLSFGDYLSDMSNQFVDNADSITKVLPCSNPSLDYMAFVLQMDLINTDYTCNVDYDLFPGFNIGGGDITINGTPIHVPAPDLNDDIQIPLGTDYDVAASDIPFQLSFGNITEFLEGFEIKDIQAKIYISGSPLVDVLSINLEQQNNDNPMRHTIYDGRINNCSSGIGSGDETYAGIGLPHDNGNDIDIYDMFHSGGIISIHYDIKIKAGEKINLSWINNPQRILAEIVIWIPMEFETTTANAVLKFPDFFSGIGDTMKSMAGVGLVESMNIKIGIDPSNPFGDGIFVIKDAGSDFEMDNQLDEDNFNFSLSEEQLDYINNNPFDPLFSILYPNIHSVLKIPSGNIMLTTVSLNANLKYNMDLKK